MNLRSQTKKKESELLVNSKGKKEIGIFVQAGGSKQGAFSTPISRNVRRSLVFNDSNESLESTILPGDSTDSPKSSSVVKNAEKPENSKNSKNNSPVKMENFNATLGNLLNPTRTPIAPHFIPPRHFDPDCDDLPSFLQNYNQTAILNNWDDNYKLCYLSQYLRGQAQTWLQIFALRNQNADWSATIEALKKEFSFSSSISEAKLKLRYRRQQPGENVMVYLREILRLCDLVDPMMSQDLRREHFEQGLLPTYAYQVKLKQPKNFEEVQDLIKTINDAEMEIGQATKVFAQLSLSQGIKDENEPVKQRKPEFMEEITQVIKEEIGKAMHQSRPRIENNAQARTVTSRPVCFQCGKPGHKARVCYKNPKNRFGGQQNRSFQPLRSSNPQHNESSRQQHSENANGQY